MNLQHKVMSGLGAVLAFLAVMFVVSPSTLGLRTGKNVRYVKLTPIDAQGRPIVKGATGASTASESSPSPLAGLPAEMSSASGVPGIAGQASLPPDETPHGNVSEGVRDPEAGRLDFGAGNLVAKTSDPVTAPPHGERSPAPAAPSASTDPWTPVVVPAKDQPPGAEAPATPGDVIARSPAKPETGGNWTESRGNVPDTQRQIAPILAAHPDRDLVLCLAGCGGGMAIVHVRKRPRKPAVLAEMVPTSAGAARPASGDVICVAGCPGRPGEVVFRNARLSWISDEGRDEIKTALRAIADRIMASDGKGEPLTLRDWVSVSAREHLLAAPSRVSGDQAALRMFAGPAVAAWIARLGE